ncbi:MAG: hypothetical protein NWR47_07975 [Aestuariivirgaceae bacterium]|nr:hypothetical protein [Aestuariivirgaceae bacterium]
MYSFLPTKNLVLVVDKSRCDPADFLDIAQRMRAQADDVIVQVLQPETIHSIAPETWRHPTLFVCLVRIRNLAIRRGNILMTRPIPKLRQAEMMQLANVATPHVERYRFGMQLDEALWGSHVVLKPEELHFTSKGVGLEVIAAGSLSGKNRQDFAPDHFAHQGTMLVQRFVDTGRHPVIYRAMTFMGEVLTIYKVTYAPEKTPGMATVPTDFHSKTLETHREFEHFPDVYEFARQTASAFRHWPLLGCDILQEDGTEKLYTIEVNAGGNVWHFSSPFNAKQRQEHPEFNAPRLNQYGAFDVAAKALIKATRQLAV